ncbi:XisI protein [Candidatus Oscillochloris fontis]|uniref:XisI protein n=1 Tax=Candidatus Oscillochloris fontis TaxID=2496868 RepID=UPI00101B8FD5|nr:XisI protein [Candidatus Oscillochloris fontis]
MDTVTQYRTYIEQILRDYSAYTPSYGDIDVELIMDYTHDHYQLLRVGWHKQQRIHGIVLHIDIRDGKIWIQHDGTEEGVANQLVEKGVPKTDIVLGFQSPYKRQFTDFSPG